ncbi:MAG TPA: DUF1549 domain-containing protein, partial [Humisphaera sp.]
MPAGLALLGGLACLAFAAPASASDEPPVPDHVQFNRDVRPILSDRCFACHGFDAHKRKGNLRLDTREGALAKLDDGHAVLPGKPAESLVYARVTTKDPDEVMPPPASNKKPLTDREKAVLKRWIEQGAAWEGHWAYQPVKRPEVPKVADATWVRNPVDAFVLARLEREGLKPTPEADRATLIRRVTLDLTGLPPTPAEVDAFLADRSPDAYERVVDRLLGSVRYAERMTLDWLDAARYADTHGYHIDAGRDMTRWREWVIDAFKSNKPYDAFTVEQLAGDLLPDATVEQKVASGFNRNHMVNFEGGAIAEEYRTAYVVDRVNTTGTVWLGLSVACAQCHDHKYDPITQKEYFQLYAFFNTIAEKGLDGSKGNAAPFISTPSAGQAERIEALAAKAAAAEAKLAAANPEADTAQAEWEKTIDRKPAPAAAAPVGAGAGAWHHAEAVELKSAGGATLKQVADRAVVVTGTTPAADAYTVTLAPGDLKRLAGVRVEALPDKSLRGGGPGRSTNGNAVMTGVKVAVVAGGKATDVRLGGASADYVQDGFDVADLISGKGKTGWAIFPEVGKPHEAVLELAQPVDLPAGATVVVTLEFKSRYAGHQFGRFRLGLTDVPPAPAKGGKPASAEPGAADAALAAALRTEPA